MIQFNELKITADNKNLIVDISVKQDDYYEEVYIDKIVIDSQNTYIDNGPSTTPVYTYISEGNAKNIRLVIDYREVSTSFENNLFFVYAIAKGTPSIDTPCGMDNIKTIGVAFNITPIYNNMISHIRELGNTCTIPMNFIDSILQFKALELYIKTEDYSQTVNLWNKVFCNIKSYNNINICNCHG